jgi:hypothetical protein
MTAIETTLPSVRAAEAYWLDEPGATANVITSTLLRAGLIGVGLFLVGQRKGLVRGGLGGALAIEAFVLWSVHRQLKAAGRLASVSAQG